MRPPRRPLRRALGPPLIAAFLVTVALAGPAAAHPFGPPSQAAVSADGDTVTVRWSAAEDDWVALGHHLGAFDAATAAAGADATVPRTGEELLAASPGLASYLLDGLAVRQSGVACAGQVPPVTALLAEGVTMRFTCPQPVDEVALDLRLLTDLNPAYRTAATVTGATPARTLLTSAAPVVELDFGAGGAGGGVLPTVALAALALTALLGLGMFALRRRVPAEVTP